MRFLILLLVVLRSLPALAQDRLDDRFNPVLLTSEEKRFLQGALAYRGYYTGLLDGKWGNGSQTAMAAMARNMDGPPEATWRKAAVIARNFRTALETEGWRPVRLVEVGFSFLLPTENMRQTGKGAERQFTATGGALQVRTTFGSLGAMGQMHAMAVAKSPGFRAEYSLARPDRFITSTKLTSGSSIYIRSDAQNGGFGTVVVEWKPVRANAARLIVASLTRAQQTALTMPRDGMLRRMIRRLRDNRDSPQPQPRPQPKPESGRHLAGTGFYINNTDLLASATVMNDCATPELANGTGLRKLRPMADREVVLLTSAARSSHWLQVGSSEVPDAGTPLAISRYDSIGTQVALRDVDAKVVMRLKPDTGTVRLLISTASEPFQLGAPLFDTQGRVAAVVTSGGAESDSGFMRHMSLATPVARLSEALRKSAVLFAPADTTAGTETAPDREAIVPIFCR